ncbi:hypothetical protein F2P56_009038 [Juglans regia]|uniref:Uncharacterized protein LOC108981123 n=2 Tax=Juglans regia TaxID=51240 RepID=A0A2I4DKS9_JUGRE|nr:uncharacterized protein LOC108981123 [Juglans regia]KAF5472311.1 hypothetical protein F2P56_009038 [Juglans regia]
MEPFASSDKVQEVAQFLHMDKFIINDGESGDFNIIKDDSERRGGRPRPRMAMEDFNNWIDNCGLIDMRSSGRRFSWCNGQRGLARSWAKLDRGLVNASCLTRFPNMNNCYLSRSTSDHSPMFLQFQSDLFKYGHSPFRFQQMWIDHPDFHQFVGRIWTEEVGGFGLLKLAFKLKKLRGSLREWNKGIFGRTEAHIQGLENKIEELESDLQQNWNSGIEQDLVSKNMELASWRRREEIRLAQLAKIKWRAEGDQNSSFFHAILSFKRKKRVLDMRLQDGTYLGSPEEIYLSAVNYFSNFLQCESHDSLPDLSHIISAVISLEDNAILGAIPSINEVKNALDSIPSNSAPGPDGFGSGFFKSV